MSNEPLKLFELLLLLLLVAGIAIVVGSLQLWYRQLREAVRQLAYVAESFKVSTYGAGATHCCTSTPSSLVIRSCGPTSTPAKT